MLSERGKELIIYNQFKFTRSRDVQAGIRWRCTKKSCGVTILTDATGEKLLEGPASIHLHPVDSTLARQIVSNSVKRKAMDDICAKPVK